jgi:hypothetical protein
VLLPPQSARGALTPVVEAQELGDPPADAEPGDVCAGQVERVEQAGGVGDEVAQGVLRVVRIHRRGATGVTQLVADHEPRARGEAPQSSSSQVSIELPTRTIGVSAGSPNVSTQRSTPLTWTMRSRDRFDACTSG